MSNDELAKTIPVKPPTVKRKIKSRAQSIAGDHLMLPPCDVANQLKTFTLVGIMILIVVEEKYAHVSISVPTVNMW